MSLSVSSTVSTYPSLPYKKIKDSILGSDYSLSLVFVGDKKSQSLNKKYRQKNYTPNVLSFPLDKTHGEIYLNQNEAKRDVKDADMDVKKYIGFLFVHALLHLKGYRHGAKMDKAESRYTKQHGFV